MFRKIAACAAVGIAAAGAIVLGQTAASAGTVTQQYTCGSVFGGGWTETWRMTITAPATANRGQTITLGLGMEKPDWVGSWPANTYSAEFSIGAFGATSGGTTATGMVNPELHSEPFRFTGSTPFTLANVAGDVEFRPGAFKALWGQAGYEYCLKTTPQTAATTHVV